MELDLQTVKALSSPTRIKIIDAILESESTPTQLSEDLGKSKSTVVSHLEKLSDAGLVEKDSEEGRRRVTYYPTRKARAIVEGRERKVKFSLASSVVSGVGGAALLASNLKDMLDIVGFQSQSLEPQAAQLSADAARTGAEAVSGGGLPEASALILFLGLGLLGVSLMSLVYGLTVRKLADNASY